MPEDSNVTNTLYFWHLELVKLQNAISYMNMIQIKAQGIPPKPKEFDQLHFVFD